MNDVSLLARLVGKKHWSILFVCSHNHLILITEYVFFSVICYNSNEYDHDFYRKWITTKLFFLVKLLLSAIRGQDCHCARVTVWCHAWLMWHYIRLMMLCSEAIDSQWDSSFVLISNRIQSAFFLSPRAPCPNIQIQFENGERGWWL